MELAQQEPQMTVEPCGTKLWRVNHLWHRLDGPAMIRPNGTQVWYVNDQLHRIDGPALILSTGGQQWYINDCNLTKEITTWMVARGVSWPWDESTQVEFLLTWS